MPPRLDLYEGAKYKSNVNLAQEYRRRRDKASHNNYIGSLDVVSRTIALCKINLLEYYRKHRDFKELIVAGLGKKTLSDLSNILKQGPLKKNAGRASIDEMIF